MAKLYIVHDLSGNDDNHYYLDKEQAELKAIELNEQYDTPKDEINENGYIVQTVYLNTQAKCINCPNIATDKDSICLPCYHK